MQDAEKSCVLLFMRHQKCAWLYIRSNNYLEYQYMLYGIIKVTSECLKLFQKVVMQF